MFEKFIQENKAENLRRWLDTVDLESADVLGVEREIYAALVKANRTTRWNAVPIAPLAEPVDLDALVGDLFNDAQSEIRYQVNRTDNLYSWLSELNNVLKSEIESVERQVVQASDDIQDISIVIGDENRNFFWVSDSFNTNSYVDLDKTTCLIDTDYGDVTLGPQNIEVIADFSPEIDFNETKGLPGANLVIVNQGKFGVVDQEPQPLLESTDTRNFGAIFDSDPSTWFEIERNFIPPIQKLRRQGRAFVYSESGIEQNIKEATQDLDWKVIVEWPGGFQDGGPDGKGVELAEFRDITKETNPDNTKAKLVFDLVLDTPQSLSSLRLLPFSREGIPINIDSIRVLLGQTWIDVAKDVELGSNRSTTKLQREILRRTGVQTTGSIFSIPSDREVSRIRISLSSIPSVPQFGFGHPFKDVETEFRTERNHVFYRTANVWRDWGRSPVNTETPKIESKLERPKIVGALLNVASATYAVGKIFNNLTAPVVAGGAGISLGGSLGAVGSWLGRAVPIIGAVLALDALVGGLFAVEKDSHVTQVKTGFDVFTGQRASIGIRDCSLLKTTYSSDSVVQSVKREFPGPVSKIGLFIDDHVPESWGPGDWITYYASVDGTTWVPMPKLTDTTLEKSLVLDTPTRTIFFRAVLKGNPNDKYHTPVVNHYAFQGLPA